MKAFLNAAAKKGSALRVAAACAGLGIAALLLLSTTGGLGHGKMYLGPRHHRGIIIYCRENPPAFVAATVFNYAVAAGLVALSATEIVAAMNRRRPR